MPWVLFGFTAAFIWATANIIDKYLFGSKLVKNPRVPVMVSGIIAFFVGILLFSFFPETSLLWHQMLLALVAGILGTCSILLYFFAVQREEISRIVPLWFFTPLFILLLSAAFLGERLTFGEYFGVLFLVCGAVGITWQGGVRFRIRRAFWFMIMASFLWGTGQVMTGYLLNFESLIHIYPFSLWGAFLGTLPLWHDHKNDILHLYRQKEWKVFLLITMSESFSFLGTFLVYLGAQNSPLTLVSALTAVQPLLVLLMVFALTRLFPSIVKEESSHSIFVQKFVFIVTMIAGAILIG